MSKNGCKNVTLTWISTWSIGSWAILPICESHPCTSSHRFIRILDSIDVLLLLLHFGVLRHIVGRTEVIKVTSVKVRFEIGNIGRIDIAKVIPIDPFEEGMTRHVGKRRIPTTCRSNKPRETVLISMVCTRIVEIPCNQVPGGVRHVKNCFIRLVILRSPKDLGPVLQIRPRFLWCPTAERGKASQELKKNATKGPVIDGIGVRLPP